MSATPEKFDAIGHALLDIVRVLAIALAIPAGLSLIHVSYKLWTGQLLFEPGSLPFEIMRAYVEFFWRMFDSASPTDFNDLDPPVQGILVFVPNIVAFLAGVWSLIALFGPVRRVSD